MHSLNVNDAACAYLLKMPRPYQRSVALARCTSHLVEVHEYSHNTAELAAIQAIAELETLNRPAYIDASASTAHVVIIRRPGQQALALSVNDLLRLDAQTQPMPHSGSRH